MKKFFISIYALLIISGLLASCGTLTGEGPDSTPDTVSATVLDTRPIIVDFGDYIQPVISGASIDEIIAQCPEDCEFMGGNISKEILKTVFSEFPFKINYIAYRMRELSPDVYEEYKEKNWDNEYGSFEISIPRSEGSSEAIYLNMSDSAYDPNKAAYKPHENIPELFCHEKYSHLYVVVINENLYFQLVLTKDPDFSILQQYTEYCISVRKIINQESTQ